MSESINRVGFFPFTHDIDARVEGFPDLLRESARAGGLPAYEQPVAAHEIGEMVFDDALGRTIRIDAYSQEVGDFILTTGYIVGFGADYERLDEDGFATATLLIADSQTGQIEAINFADLIEFEIDRTADLN